MIENKTCLFILLSLFCFVEMSSQNETDTLAASTYFIKADSLLKNKSHNKSILLFKKALHIFKKGNFFNREADCYQKLGKNYEGISDYKKALEFYNKSIHLKQEKLPSNNQSIAKSFSNLGDVNFKTSNYNEALIFFDKALKITLTNLGKSHQETGDLYNNMGLCYYYLGDLYEALNYLKKSLDIDLKTLEKNHINIGFSYINVGLLYHELKQDDKALSYYQKALPCFVENKYDNGLIGVYNNTGNILKSKGKWNKALEYYDKSLAITREYYKQDTNLLALICMNIGDTYRMLGAFDKALVYLNKSLENYKSISNLNPDGIAKAYDNIGALYSAKEKYSYALKYHEKALNIHKKNKKLLETAYSLQDMGKLKCKFKMYDDALLYHKQALQIIEDLYGPKHLLTSCFQYQVGLIHYKVKNLNAATAHFNNSLSSNSKNPLLNESTLVAASKYFDHQLALKTWYKKAQTERLKYNQTQEQSYLESCKIFYNQADFIIDYIRQSFNNHQDKLLSAKQAKAIYSAAIATYILDHKHTGHKKSLAQAWYFAEKSRSNTLKDLLNDAQSKTFHNLPDSILNTEKKLKSDQAYYQSQIVAEQSKNVTDTNAIRGFENKLFTIVQKKDALIELLKREHPKYHKSKHAKTIFSVEDIQKKLSDNTTVLEFYTTHIKTYAFIISKNNFIIKELKTPELTKNVEKLRKAITSENINTYKQTAQHLYSILISPIKDKLIGDELIIIPDRSLWYLNFDLLLTEKNKTQNSRNLPYLLKDYAISYANSADLHFNIIQNPDENSKKRNKCLAFSYSNPIEKSTDSTQTENFKDDLPGTKAEIKAISKILDGQFLEGTKAVEATFKKQANQYNIIHLALHGDVDNNNPQNSKLYFTQNKDSIEDNILYNHELFALNIPADLVVLSACNTGTGKVSNGEGLMSLGNAFQYAGSKSLLLSKWEVPDKTTPKLMTHFYSNLKNGMNKSKALQQAKLKYLATAEAFYTNPFYWGSFYIIGNTDPVNFDSSSNTTYIWIISIIICTALLYLLIKRLKRN